MTKAAENAARVFKGCPVGITLGKDEHRMQLDGTEIETAEWVQAGDVANLVIPRLARRLASAYRAHICGASLYLEHGEVTPQSHHQVRPRGSPDRRR